MSTERAYGISPKTLEAIAANLDGTGRIRVETLATVLAEHEPGRTREVAQEDDRAFDESFEARFGRPAPLAVSVAQDAPPSAEDREYLDTFEARFGRSGAL